MTGLFSQAASAQELFEAAEKGNEEVVKTCLAKGANVDGHRSAVSAHIHTK